MSEGRYSEAIPPLRSMVEMGEGVFGADHPHVAQARLNLFAALTAAGRYVEAEGVARHAVDVFRGVGHRHRGQLTRALGLLASTRETLGDFDEAAALYDEALALQQSGAVTARIHIAELNNNLAAFHVAMRQYDEAERLFLDNVALRQSMLPSHDPEIGISMANLGGLYLNAGRYEEAGDLLRQAVEIFSGTGGRPHPNLGVVQGYLADVHRRQGNLERAEDTAREAVAALTAALGAGHSQTASALHTLALTIADQGRFAEAADIHGAAIAVHEDVYGPDHPRIADGLQLLASALQEQGRLDDARTALERGLAIRMADPGDRKQAWPERLRELRKALNPETAITLHGLAAAAAAANDDDAAETYLEPAMAILARRFVLQAANADALAAAERRAMREIFLSHVTLMTRLADLDAERRSGRIAAAFESLQWAHVSRTGDTAARIARAMAQGDESLWNALRERETTLQYLNRVDQQITEYLGRPQDERDRASLGAMQTRRAAYRDRLTALDRELTGPSGAGAGQGPAGTVLAYTDPTPVSLAQTQSLLAEDEAVLAYGFGDRGHLVVVRRDAAAAFSLPISADELAQAVAQLRLGLDPSEGRLRAFDVNEANALFEAVLQPAMDLLAGTRHLIMVPDGALESLPFAVLVTEPYDAVGRLRGSDYQNVAWLGRNIATTTLPSLAAFAELRRAPDIGARGFAAAANPFVGITGPDSAWLRDRPGVGSGGDRASVRWYGALDRADDLGEASGLARDLADIYGATEDSIISGDMIREDRFYERAMGLETHQGPGAPPLDSYAVVAFVTHGFERNDEADIEEPALLLGYPEDPEATPPPNRVAAPRALDGFLYASEVLSLSLNAEWVLLTACNTAAGEGPPGSEQLSGLARAFFHAGARRLLVSHWPVRRDAARPLVGGMVDHMARGAAPAEALRLAMSAFIDSRPAAFTGHPAYWAPFTIVGAGT